MILILYILKMKCMIPIVSIASGTCTYEELLEFVKARLIDYNPLWV